MQQSLRRGFAIIIINFNAKTDYSRFCECLHVTVWTLLFYLTQDYAEEFRDITKGSKSKEALPAGSITLINQRPVGEDLHVKFCYNFSRHKKANTTITKKLKELLCY